LKKFFKRGGGAGDAGADQQNLFNNMKQKAEKIIKVQGVQPPAENQETQSAGTLIGSRNNISRTVAIVSGKGGVGKSTVSSLLASGLIMRGYRVGILDADITGPSIPRAFGLKGGYMARNDFGIIPRRTEMDIKIMSLNLFLEDENDPVVWRGPRISGAVREFYSQVDWGRLDFLLLDMPPGTGDIAITVLQELPLQGAVIVTTPQDIAFTVVRKAYKMMCQHSIPVLGMVENFKTGVCPQCGHDFSIYTDLGVENWCRENKVRYLGGLPWDALLGQHADQGTIEKYYSKDIDRMVDNFLQCFF
jgi:Mrp family chromosome partitioning ATPase